MCQVELLGVAGLMVAAGLLKALSLRVVQPDTPVALAVQELELVQLERLRVQRQLNVNQETAGRVG